MRNTSKIIHPSSGSSDTAGRREVMAGLAKGLEVIRAFTHQRPSMTLNEIATVAGLTPATARRCLHTLEELGYMTRDGRRFLLRPKVLELGAAYLDSMNIESVTRTYLEDLAREFGDSASLCVLDGVDIVYLARASIRTLVRLEAHVGSRFPAYPTSTGRVLLSGLDAPELAQYFSRAEIAPLTERTVTDKKTLARLIGECKRVGYAAVEDELAYGVVSVAVPVKNRDGRIVAALNSSGHSKRMGKSKLVTERLPKLQAVSRTISAEIARIPGLRLGY